MRAFIAISIGSLGLCGCAPMLKVRGNISTGVSPAAKSDISLRSEPTRGFKKQGTSGDASVPFEIRRALLRMSRCSKDVRDPAKVLGLRWEGDEPVYKESVGRVHFVMEEWKIGFGDRYLLSYAGWTDGSGSLGKVSLGDVVILEKTKGLDRNGRPNYREMSPAWHRKR